jgi:hypothetical protein
MLLDAHGGLLDGDLYFFDALESFRDRMPRVVSRAGIILFRCPGCFLGRGLCFLDAQVRFLGGGCAFFDAQGVFSGRGL